MPTNAFGVFNRPAYIDTPLATQIKGNEAYWGNLLANQGAIKKAKPTVADKTEGLLASVVGKHVAKRAMSPLADLTPVGNVVGADEGQRTFRQGLSKGDLKTAAIGAGIFGLSMLPFAGGAKRKGGRLLSDLLRDESGAIRAWHGSPHDFDRFDMSKIGTGEGAQAYGHGLYFAENKAVADQYRNILSNRSKATDDPASAASFWLGMNNGDRDATIKTFENMKAQNQRILDRVAQRLPVAPGAAGHALSEIQAADEALAHLASGTEAKSGGRLYEVNINAEPEDFLDWDAPITGKARDALIEAGHIRPQSTMHGQPVYRGMADGVYHATDAGNFKTDGLGRSGASEALRDLGIPGLKYLDQGSRGAGNGTRNYVVFDDSLIDILRKY